MKKSSSQMLKKIANFLTKRQKYVLVLLVIIGVGLIVQPVHAQSDALFDVVEFIKDIVAWIVSFYVYVVGAFLTSVLIPVLLDAASYNDFASNPVISTGWSLVRDVGNTFFIVVLLVIAFSTMLQIKTYHYKQALVKLIIMAVLINFSKLISTTLIDFFQVIMLTFVRGFAAAAGGNFIQAFKIYDMLAIASGAGGSPAAADSLELLAVIGGLVLAAVGLSIVVMIILILIVVLLYRIIMLWLLVVISPLAYFAYTIRPNYWSQWWQEFFKQLTTGPVIAFFLWLVLLTSSKLGSADLVGSTHKVGAGEGLASGAVLASGFAVPAVFINFLTMVALSIGGLVIAQKMAAQTGAGAGNIAGKIRSGGKKALMGAGALALLGAKKGGKLGWGTVKAGGKGVRGGYRMAMNQWAARSDSTKKTGINKIARTTKTWAEKVGSFQGKSGFGKVGSAILTATGIRKIGEKTYDSLGARKKAIDEKALENVSKKKSSRPLLSKIANKVAITPAAIAQKDAVAKFKPTVMKDQDMVEFMKTAKEDDIKNINPNEWKAIGAKVQAGDFKDNKGKKINFDETKDFSPDVQNLLSSSRIVQGSYNMGATEAFLKEKGITPKVNTARSADILDGLSSAAKANENNDLRKQAKLGEQTIVTGTNAEGPITEKIDFSDLKVFGGQGTRRFDSGQMNRKDVIVDVNSDGVKLKEKFMDVDEDKRDAERGDGKTSVNAFGSGESNVAAIDYDKVDLAFMNEEGDENKDKAGINISDEKKKKRFAARMSGAKLDEESLEQIDDETTSHQDSVADIDRNIEQLRLEDAEGNAEEINNLEESRKYHQDSINKLDKEKHLGTEGGQGVIQMQIKGLEELKDLDHEIEITTDEQDKKDLQDMRSEQAKELGVEGMSADGVDNRLKQTKQAQSRFARIAHDKEWGGDDINVINSSAAGYDGSQLREAKDHEELHSLGIEDEETVRKVTGAMKKNHVLRGAKKEVADAVLNAQTEGKNVDEVLDKMATDMTAAQGAKRSGEVPADNFNSLVDKMKTDASKMQTTGDKNNDEDLKTDAKELQDIIAGISNEKVMETPGSMRSFQGLDKAMEHYKKEIEEKKSSGLDTTPEEAALDTLKAERSRRRSQAVKSQEKVEPSKLETTAKDLSDQKLMRGSKKDQPRLNQLSEDVQKPGRVGIKATDEAIKQTEQAEQKIEADIKKLQGMHMDTSGLRKELDKVKDMKITLEQEKKSKQDGTASEKKEEPSKLETTAKDLSDQKLMRGSKKDQPRLNQLSEDVQKPGRVGIKATDEAIKQTEQAEQKIEADIKKLQGMHMDTSGLRKELDKVKDMKITLEQEKKSKQVEMTRKKHETIGKEEQPTPTQKQQTIDDLKDKDPELDKDVEDLGDKPDPTTPEDLGSQSMAAEDLLSQVVSKLTNMDSTLGDIAAAMKKGSDMTKSAGLNEIKKLVKKSGQGASQTGKFNVDKLTSEVRFGRHSQRTGLKDISGKFDKLGRTINLNKDDKK